MTRSNSRRPLLLPRWLPRLAVIVAGLGLWFWTQSLIGEKAPAPAAHGLGDAVHEATARANAWLNAHAGAANALLIASSVGIDALGLFILGSTLFGKSVRPFLGLIVLFGLRQICQALTSLPPPEGMVWRSPGFPSFLVTYGVSNDLFFSGHTALALFGCLELARLGRPWLLAAVALALFQIAVVLVLRAHYTIDVFAGAVAALWVGSIAPRLAAPVDARLDSWAKPMKRSIRSRPTPPGGHG